jgi:hypothetical protein
MVTVVTVTVVLVVVMVTVVTVVVVFVVVAVMVVGVVVVAVVFVVVVVFFVVEPEACVVVAFFVVVAFLVVVVAAFVVVVGFWVVVVVLHSLGWLTNRAISCSLCRTGFSRGAPQLARSLRILPKECASPVAEDTAPPKKTRTAKETAFIRS